MRVAAGLCTPEFRELAASLGGVRCEGARPFVYLNDPRELAGPTMPVVELLVLVGAVAAGVHAWRWWRVKGDASGLGVLLAAVVYVLVLEPPLYFPALFGLDGYVPAVFVHGSFTVGFLYERLPLYIALFYPALVYLAWALVVRLGVPERAATRWGRRRGPLVAAVTVGAVHACLYTAFDQFGPQHLWWAWDDGARSNAIRIASVPLSSTVNFSLVMPAGFALLALLLLRRPARRTLRSVLGPAVVVGALTPLVTAPLQLPVTYLDLVDEPSYGAVRVVLLLMLGTAGLVAGREVLAAWRDRQRPSDVGRYPVLFGATWIAAFAVLWLTALPNALRATDGITPQGTPAGSWAVSFLALGLSALVVAAAARRPVGRALAAEGAGVAG